MIKYVGFGNIAGFLANRGLLGSSRGEIVEGKKNEYSDDENTDTEEYAKIQNK